MLLALSLAFPSHAHDVTGITLVVTIEADPSREARDLRRERRRLAKVVRSTGIVARPTLRFTPGQTAELRSGLALDGTAYGVAITATAQ